MSESQIVPLVLGTFGTDTDLGLFQAARHLPLLVTFVLASTTPLLVGRIPELLTPKDRPRLQALLRWNAAVSTGAAIVAFVAIAGPAEMWLKLYGEGFGEARTALRLLLAVKCFNAACGPVYQLVWLTGNHRFALGVMGTAAALGGLVTAITAPSLGCLGGALGSATSTLVWTISYLWFILRFLKLNPTFTAWLRGSEDAPL